MSLYAEIVFPLPVDQSFSYLVPEAFLNKAKIGSRVAAPFGHRRLTGFIVNLNQSGPPPEFELKEIVDVLDEEPVFSPALLSLTRKLSDYYYSSWGELLQAALPPSFILKSQTKVFLTEEGKLTLEKESLAKEEREILGLLDKRACSLTFLKRKLGAQNFSRLLPRLERENLIGFRSRGKNRCQTILLPRPSLRWIFRWILSHAKWLTGLLGVQERRFSGRFFFLARSRREKPSIFI